MLGKNSTTKLAQEDLNLVILLSLQSSLDYKHLPQSMDIKTIFETIFEKKLFLKAS